MVFDLRRYLDRIGYDGPTPSPTLETLRAMHMAHFWHVPFENLDIARRVTIAVDEEINFHKIVERRRGGFCLELTGTFARALRRIGFNVDVIGARVLMDGRLSEPMSHMTLIVHLDESWIADVGFGGRVAEPLRMDERGEQQSGIRRYFVANDGDHWLVTCIEPQTAPMTYMFTLQPREFDEFEPVCEWLQTSPDSRFTQGDIASIATPTGRVTLSQDRLLIVEDGARSEHELTSGDEKRGILSEHFGIVVDR